MKIKVNFNEYDRKLICNFLCYLNTKKIQGIMDKYDAYKPFKEIEAKDVFEGAKYFLDNILKEREVFKIDNKYAIPFMHWLGAQCEDDTLALLECEMFDEKVYATDYSLLNLYGFIDNAYEKDLYGWQD